MTDQGSSKNPYDRDGNECRECDDLICDDPLVSRPNRTQVLANRKQARESARFFRWRYGVSKILRFDRQSNETLPSLP